MRVRYSGDREGDLRWLTWDDFMSVKLPDLATVPDDELRRCHRHVKRELWKATGPRRMGGGIVVLNPLEAEMRRRGLKAVYWARERRIREIIENMGSRPGM